MNRNLIFKTKLSHRAAVSEPFSVTGDEYREIVENLNGAVVVVQDSVFVFASRCMRDLLGAPCGGLEGKLFTDLVVPEDRGLVIENYRRQMSGYIRCNTYDFRFMADGGRVIWVSFSGVMIRWRGRPATLGMVTDITARKLCEEKVSELLAGKDLLLKEVHHRVKNNISCIISLLSLQADDLLDSTASSIIRDARNRLYSMMVLYDKLYRTTDFRGVSVRDYISHLVDEIIINFPNSKSVKVNKNIDDFVLNAEKLQPLGIIINELITNSMKYAFTGRTEGVIGISAVITGSHVSIVVRDNGKGLPESVDFGNPEGFGFILVDLMTKQMGGNMSIIRDGGTAFIMEFDA